MADLKHAVPDNVQMKEFSYKAVILGAILAVIFGMANAYLGLKVGMTVSASIPAAVVSMAILRYLKGTILENNMSQTVGSAGESLAAGVIFTIPAMFIWGLNPDLLQIFIMALLGGWMGVLFMIPLRKYLIVKEHYNLPYPEGTACAEVLVAGQEGGVKARSVFIGGIIGAVYKFAVSGLKMFNGEPEAHIKGIKNGLLGMEATPSLLAVGYIIGPKIAAYMLGGGLLGWFVFIPLISFFGQFADKAIFPAADLIKNMDAWGVWTNYIRYIGAGAVAFGGFISLIKSLPTIISSFKEGVSGFKMENKQKEKRTDKDIPSKYVLIGIIVIAIFTCLWFVSQGIAKAPLVTLLVVVFSFFFVTVSSRIVGIVGSSSNPASGMTIATLLIVSIILVYSGYIGQQGMIAAITIGAIVCIGICIAGDTSQDLKTGYLVGATPWKQQLGELIGVFASALAIGSTLYLLNDAYVIGSSELAAPQASLMAIVIKGVMESNLPWGLVFTGAFSAGVIELFGINSLAFAVGLYLPMSLSTPIMVGGLVRLIVDKKNKVDDEGGILFSSGVIAGEALMGVIIALFVYYKWDVVLDIFSNVYKSTFFYSYGILIPFAIVTIFLYRISRVKK
ncbi:MAG: oligopeptide transporter, OPT family [Candidatus Muirbacterium halophilum]|nr:oligopeptide transporter, OPT family [Candidatus Muirbacterium halophilum]